MFLANPAVGKAKVLRETRAALSKCGSRWFAGGFGRKSIAKMCQTLNELKLHPYMAVLKLPLLVDVQHKVGELVLSITSCPSIIILENVLN
jgi:hypothetical protein